MALLFYLPQLQICLGLVLQGQRVSAAGLLKR
jgi:hypothetical protein